MTLVKDIYRLTSGFPQDERFGLMSQLRRSEVLSKNDNVRLGQSRNVLLTGSTLLSFLKGEQGGQRGATEDETA